MLDLIKSLLKNFNLDVMSNVSTDLDLFEKIEVINNNFIADFASFEQNF